MTSHAQAPRDSRIEVRLDHDRRRKLESLAEEAGTSISDIVRAMIDEAFEVVGRERRRRAVEAIAAMAIEDLPDPEELSQQLDETYALPDLDAPRLP